MKNAVMVFGGTGYYGRHIVKSLVKKGISTRVLSRDYNKARKILGNEPEIIEGNVTEIDTIKNTLIHTKAVIICLSAMNKRLFRQMKAIERDAVINILNECQNNGIKRIVYVSGSDK